MNEAVKKERNKFIEIVRGSGLSNQNIKTILDNPSTKNAKAKFEAIKKQKKEFLEALETVNFVSREPLFSIGEKKVSKLGLIKQKKIDLSLNRKSKVI